MPCVSSDRRAITRGPPSRWANRAGIPPQPRRAGSPGVQHSALGAVHDSWSHELYLRGPHGAATFALAMKSDEPLITKRQYKVLANFRYQLRGFELEAVR